MTKTILTSRATAVGGRDGKVASDDNVINLDLVMPGTKGKEDIPTSNPEQLFAAGYAACFDGAFNLMARQDKKRVETRTNSEVSLLEDEEAGGVKIAAKLVVEVVGVTEEEAQDLLEKTHQFCPYSKATRGNIDVDLSVKVVDSLDN
ncbi:MULTISPECIES: Ohr family peroxiredoxin [Exiguobacterium]|uniref:OsmC family protein n=1 Tax=Exiguobacterium sibiricum (strain DSM 17290 / CCUG 55495 / CIP 109462 / JCM 13490 / 255-15) TaxID=262543 RepID=B1YJI5_EXIS2|nr:MULTISPECIES: Ohr family peroxiredoxin [Exiguobacterium]ACB60015.1 OsmC family protein [Exiguobacterium sibiricum 255-15]MCT4792566.1 Ohr family peroxiredoxin [Exiguobacterium artemiae]MDX1260410.1 Ohr family peroxiredoxin [Exiguobacterium sp. K1]